jgi:hypothetical protein
MRYFEGLKIGRKKSIYATITALTFLFTIYGLSTQLGSVFAQIRQDPTTKQR